MRPAVRMAMDMVTMPMQGTDPRTAHARITVASAGRAASHGSRASRSGAKPLPTGVGHGGLRLERFVRSCGGKQGETCADERSDEIDREVADRVPPRLSLGQAEGE